MSDMRVVKEYACSRPVLWKTLTDPALVPLWTSTGQGGRPEGFKPEVGIQFKFIGKPFPGWDGIVRCEVLRVDRPALLRYSWRNKPDDEPTMVTCRLDETADGTRLTWEHTGFRGAGSCPCPSSSAVSDMLTEGLPQVLDDLDEEGNLRPGSELRPQG